MLTKLSKMAAVQLRQTQRVCTRVACHWSDSSAICSTSSPPTLIRRYNCLSSLRRSPQQRRASYSTLVTGAIRCVRATNATATISTMRIRSVSPAMDSAFVRRFASGLTSNRGRLTAASETDDDRMLVIGSGAAGSAAALIAAETHGVPVTLLFAGKLPTDCNTYWAQGGIIYRNYDGASGDSADLLAADIRRAGAGLCDDNAVRLVAERGPDRVRELLLNYDFGEGEERRLPGAFAAVPFHRDEETGELSLCLEASHSAPRILFKADHTGQAIAEHLSNAVARHPLIRRQPHTVVTDLIVEEGVCLGVQTIDRSTGLQRSELASRGTVLAAGGLAGIYRHSTNPAGFNALGSSVALAVRAGAETRDLEYVQFHPTALCVPGQPRFLLTEALRGEGAILRDATGRAFARDYHPDGELAPRDVVARAVFEESQKAAGAEQHNAFLDISHRDREWLHRRFPSVKERVLELSGLDLADDPLPITPAAHYACGGVSSDLRGRASIDNLYCAGEAARTGLHGGNRLASTSLLEGIVFGAAAADSVASERGKEVSERARYLLRRPELSQQLCRRRSTDTWRHEHSLPAHHHHQDPSTIENVGYRAMDLLRRVRETMWDEVGVVRTSAGLSRAVEELRDLALQADRLHATCPTLETSAVRDACTAGRAVAEAALGNPVSAGAHCLVASSAEEEDDDDQADEVASL